MTEMHNEVIEAILEYYKGDEDMAADCLVWLESLKHISLSFKAATALEDMGRCATCGCKLDTYVHTEYHTEVDEPPYCETVVELYCPQCDIAIGGDYV